MISPSPHSADISPSEARANAATAIALVETLGRALHAYGSSAHRLENALDLVSRQLGLRGHFFSTPTAIFASFEPEAETSTMPPRTVLLRVEPGDVDLERLVALDAVLGRVMRGDQDPADALDEVDQVIEAPPRYGRVLTFLAFALASGGAARFFGGGVNEVAVATGIGLVTGLLAWVADRLPNAGRLYETVAAMATALLATAAAATMPVAFPVITVSALIVLVPGLTLTVAMTELATRNLVSGAARMAGALLMFLTMGVGFAVGSRLGGALFGAPVVHVPVTPPAWTEAPALLVTAAALLVLFRGHPRELPAFVVAGAVALFGSRAGTAWIGPELGALVGALLVGVGSNGLARWRDRPAVVTMMPGLMLLVPGSLGFRSVASLVEQDTLSGLQTAFTVVLVAIALVTGLLLANVVMPPRRVL